MTVAVTSGKPTAPTAASAATRTPAGKSEAAPDGTAFLLALGACSAEADAAPVDQALADPLAPGADALPLPTQTGPQSHAELPPAAPALPVIDAAALLAQGAFAAVPSAPAPVTTPLPAPANEIMPVAIAATTATATTVAVGTPAPMGPPGPAAAPPVLQGASDTSAKAATASVPSDEPIEAAVSWRGAMHAGSAAPAASHAGAGLTSSQSQSHQPAASPSDARAPAHIAAAMAEPAAQAAFVAAGMVPRRSERADERALSMFWPTSGPDTQAGYVPGGSPLMSAVDAASAGAAGGHAGLAERMVEQVSWWLSQRTQSAELTLNVPGGAPVSVSIQVQGNEAQVAFRSDQPEARQLLASAMPQLKEMLGAEGLVLSGSSVGTSNSGGRQGDRPPGTPARAGHGDADTALAPDVPIRRLAAGRTLDLYV